MDVRCEKCQTEYELDEARLRPGGVTVKCTNCGHMFKIRKRASSVVPVPASTPTVPSGPIPTARATTGGSLPPMRADSLSGSEADASASERVWIIRVENGEQKSCRELATLQQWILAGTVTRESMISRTGKTWKRLGDIAELEQFFAIADEARTTRDERRAAPTGKQAPVAGTMLGIGPATERDRVPTPAPAPIQPSAGVLPAAPPPSAMPGPAMLRHPGDDDGDTDPAATSLPNLRGPAPALGRSTAAWADGGVDKVSAVAATQRQSGPFVGKFAQAAVDEPAFAGTVRAAPPGDRAFDTGRIRPADDDDDDVLPRRGSSTGVLVLVMVLLLGGAAAVVLYFTVFRDKGDERVATPATKLDAGVLPAPADADAVVVTPVIDAAADSPAQPTLIEATRGELGFDREPRLQAALEALGSSTEPEAAPLRALLQCALAQSALDRAGLVDDRAEADKLRRDVKTLAVEAATAAQRAYKTAPDDPAANVALAHVLRLQGKPAPQVQRYLEAARAKPGPYAREVALAEGLLLARDGKLDDAKAAFAAIDAGDGKLESSNDVRARFHLALIAVAQGRPADAKPLVDQVLAAQPEHAGARLLAGKLETSVTKTDPLPPEEPKEPKEQKEPKASPAPAPVPPRGPDLSGDYDTLVRKGDSVANTSCTKAMDYYTKALEKKPNGVEALTGLGYCQLDAKNYASAHSRFRTALVISPRFEPALAGLAEAYTQQGRRDDAIAAWRRYLDAYPNSKKGTAALDRLGAPRDDAPVQPAQPTPAPDGTADPGAGSGA